MAVFRIRQEVMTHSWHTPRLYAGGIHVKWAHHSAACSLWTPPTWESQRHAQSEWEVSVLETNRFFFYSFSTLRDESHLLIFQGTVFVLASSAPMSTAHWWRWEVVLVPLGRSECSFTSQPLRARGINRWKTAFSSHLVETIKKPRLASAPFFKQCHCNEGVSPCEGCSPAQSQQKHWAGSSMENQREIRKRGGDPLLMCQLIHVPFDTCSSSSSSTCVLIPPSQNAKGVTEETQWVKATGSERVRRSFSWRLQHTPE